MSTKKKNEVIVISPSKTMPRVPKAQKYYIKVNAIDAWIVIPNITLQCFIMELSYSLPTVDVHFTKDKNEDYYYIEFFDKEALDETSER